MLEYLRAWFCEDRIRGVLRRPGRLDQPFEALVPVWPFNLPGVLRSAAQRVARSTSELGGCASKPGGSIAPPPAFASPLRRGLRRALFGAPKWRLGQLLSDPLESGPAKVQELPCECALEMADPFHIRKDGVDWVLFETISTNGLGNLAAAHLDRESVGKPGQPFLELPYHLSWPFVFEWEGETYLVPETGSAKDVALWKCEEFPNRWTRMRTLLEGDHFHDATLLHHENRWWLFVSIGGSHPGDHSAELRLYHSPDLLRAPFVPHPQNPISLSVEGARPAGKFFVRDGVIYRPAQDGRDGYGKGIVIYRVHQLTENVFAESPVSQILPPRGTIGIHTINQVSENRWIVDIHRTGKMLLSGSPLAIYGLVVQSLESMV